MQTWDHKQPDKAFYSYYHAHHLNKLLFQTQYYFTTKLIHRLRVLNPLTNTDIIGNVLYFMVRYDGDYKDMQQQRVQPPESSMIARSAPLLAQVVESPKSSPLKSPLASDPVLKNVQMHCGEGSIQTRSPSPRPTKTGSPVQQLSEESPFLINSGDVDDKKRLLPNGTAGCGGENHLYFPPPSPAKSLNGCSAMGWTLAQPLTSVATENSTTLTVPVATINSPATTIGAGNIAAPSTTGTNPGKLSAVSVDQKSRGGGTKQLLKIQTQLSPSRSARNLVETQHSMSQAPTTPNGMVVKTPVCGVPSQFGNPLSAQQASAIAPPSARNRRRPFSFMNSLITSGDTDASLDDWQALLAEDVEGEQRAVTMKSEDTDTVKQFRNLAKQPKQQQQPASPAPLKESYYEAVLFATDSDFLEQGSIRAMFKANAVQLDDATLFEMAAYNGQDQSSAAMAIVNNSQGSNGGAAAGTSGRLGGLLDLLGILFHDWRVWSPTTWLLVLGAFLGFTAAIGSIAYAIYASIRFGLG